MREKDQTCEICGDGKLYTGQGLAGHMRMKHPEGGTAPSRKAEAGRFLDNEARFLSLLQEYGVTNPERVVSYTSSLGEDIYSDLAALKKALSEQGVPTGKLPAIIKHWAATEGLPAPSKEIGAIAPDTTPLPQRFSLIGGRIVPDPNGIAYLQCLQELEVRLANQDKGSDEVKGLRAEVVSLRDALSDSRLASVMAEVKSLKEQIGDKRLGRTELDLMSEAMGKVENLVGMAGEKVDRFVRQGRDDKQLLMSLSLGITPSEYQRLLQGEEPIGSIEEYSLSRHIAAHRNKEEFVEPSKEEYQDYAKKIEARNREYQAINDKVGARLRQRTPKAEAKAKVEPEQVTVICSKCNQPFEISLAQVNQQLEAHPGEKLEVTCPNCQATVDLAILLPELIKEPVKAQA